MSRLEYDSLGSVEVNSERYYGAQTERSRKNFNICSNKDFMPLKVIYALVMIKKAASAINKSHGRITESVSNAIQAACDEILAGKFNAEFPLVIWQTGSGTQSNMNVNEVVANRAAELLGGSKGETGRVHPNDHVNCGQSSNDTFPTAMNISIAVEVTTNLRPSLQKLSRALEQKIAEFGSIVKIGRTHMQDAVPLTVGQELSSYLAQIESGMKALDDILPKVCELAIGGTAVGTGLNSFPGFDKEICSHLNEIVSNTFGHTAHKLHFTPADNKFSALAGHDALVLLACGSFGQLAAALMRLANDVRLLASGPRCGLGELILPENEPGSSIMPGKVNPTQCEALSMACVQVIGNNNAVAVAATQGHLELNVYKPLIIANCLHSAQLLADATRSFTDNCLAGMQVNRERQAHYVSQSLMLVTALTPRLGYDKAAQIAKKAHETGKSLRETVIEMNCLSGEEFDTVLRPEDMTGPTLK